MGKRAEVGVVVPTLGTRTDYLNECLDSLSSEGVFIAVIGPSSSLSKLDLTNADIVLDDDGCALPLAINKAVGHLPSYCKYISWIGDDDSLAKEGVGKQIEAFEKNPSVVATYGKCKYVDSEGKELFVQRSGKLAIDILTWGPNFVPQPGSLFRRSTWNELNGLDGSYSQSFDTDIFLRMRAVGLVVYVPHVLANYRWHDNALSVKNRWTSIVESSLARKSNSPNGLQTRVILDWPVRVATLLGGKLLSLRISKMRNRTP